jgi:hypothetical protein
MNQFPQTLSEMLPLLPFVLTLLLGIGWFLAPGAIFRHLCIEPVERHPEAAGEGRSSFAGFPIVFGAMGIAGTDPVLQFVTAAAWAAASAGKLLHVIVDGNRRASSLVRLFIAIVLAATGFTLAEVPQFQFVLPESLDGILPAVSAVVTAAYGLLAFLAPRTALSVMRLKPVGEMWPAAGEARGTLAGFYLAAAFVVLATGSFPAVLLLGLCWLMTAFGRMISMLSDNGNNLFNWLALIQEFVLAGLPLAVVFGLAG